jgi:hypothetical protein
VRLDRGDGVAAGRRRLLRFWPLWLSPIVPDRANAVGGADAAGRAGGGGAEGSMLTVHTFGDSILDCGHYNPYGVHPGQLLVRNDDHLFPEFKGRDLTSRGPAQLVHRAVDGATVAGLAAQLQGVQAPARGVALVTVGGNDLLRGLAGDTGPGLLAFEKALQAFLVRLPVRPVLLGTVYDPTFGVDEQNFLSVEPSIARANHRRVNEVIAAMGRRFGKVVDLHAHFLKGDPSWFTRTIEPSAIGASEVRRAFLAEL